MENVYLIVGLGNPGREYTNTRHNIGFMAVERLAQHWRASWKAEKKFQSRMARVEQDARRCLLCEPQTYMNLSGEAVGAVMNFYRLTPDRLLVVVDDADLPFGEIRMRADGSSGGHHGLESIEAHLGTRQYPRLRIGIGREANAPREITGYVLGAFRRADAELLDKVLARAQDQIECWLEKGIAKAMSRYNGKIILDENKNDKDKQ
ncbi:MAG TPA: aminoacyl-tRNA hydrolase [Candidatus Binatia bacterium]|nr:aminoacyl-tRNA hydrolase [Candidatus Binatia bacterium]